ncbi:hypothetical protein EYF80_058499 [Liparis tanakae]|uniref:Uncharacterized protein n=1 Tax=Liparis tanakae TaxID=230148 RepID=A0A4Z2EQZ5_9TELE|nr:hypothetical protein EYF80_058499 [Liparis tanakae]
MHRLLGLSRHAGPLVELGELLTRPGLMEEKEFPLYSESVNSSLSNSELITPQISGYKVRETDSPKLSSESSSSSSQRQTLALLTAL